MHLEVVMTGKGVWEVWDEVNGAHTPTFNSRGAAVAYAHMVRNGTRNAEIRTTVKEPL